MANKKYVPQGTYLACDKGTVPVEFMITNNNNSFLFEEPVANSGDMVPMLNVMPMGACSITGSACVPAPIMWDGFEDGIFVGFFNPLLEDAVLPCAVGGKIEIFYSLEEATAACAEEESSFWSTLGKVLLVVAAVALVVISGGAAIAAFAAIGAASGALATGIAVTVFALEVGGAVMGVMSLVNYARDGDEEALFKDVALGFLFLGAGKVIGHYADDIVKIFARGGDEALEAASKGADEVFDASKATNKQKGNFGEIKSSNNLVNNKALKDAGYDLSKIGDEAVETIDDKIAKGIDGIYENASPPPKYVIDEAKYGTSGLGKTKDGKQMSDGWVKGSKRLEDQVGKVKADDILEAMENGNVEKVLSKIDKNGNVVTKKLDDAGKIIGDWP
ncbi:DUF4280 domain-containing protein [Maribacter sp.]|nr:DUF4280 domain-containing protein [Maribacter sp.]